MTVSMFAPQEPAASIALTDEQRRIVEWGDGPAVVIAGAGTGKTRVIVERVRHLLATRGAVSGANDPLLPEHILVLTYNVKAAAELQARLEQTLGVTTAARLNVSNFHSFCQRILTEHAADAGLPPRPDVLDGVAQVLLLQDIRPQLELVYHSTTWWLGSFVQFINRCKDELVSPDDFDAFVAEERRVFEARYGDFEAARDRLALKGNLKPQRSVRGAYAGERANERAEERGEERDYRPGDTERAADREARRTIVGTGKALTRNQIDADNHPRIDALAATYVIDGAALEVMRLTELARVYRAYETELHRRGALDFGEQIAAVSQLFRTRPNVLRRWQRLIRYLLVDEFQDANVAQIELIELLGRTPDRPDNVMVVGDDDQSIYRFRGASFAAFAEFETRFAKPPTHAPDSAPPGPPTRLRLEENFRSGAHVLAAANRLIATNMTRFEPDKLLRTQRGPDEPVQVIVCAGPDDEADAIVELIKAHRSPGEGVGYPLSSFAVLYRKHKHRDAIVARLRDEDIPYTVVGGLSLFSTPEIRDLEQGLRAIADPHDDAALVRMLSGGPWRLDALEILTVTRMANFDRGHLLDAITRIVAEGTVEEDVVGEVTEDGKPAHATADAKATLRAKLRNLQSTLDELTPLVYREGPHTILERYLERTGQVLDLIAADTLESKRTVVNIASFLRFAADWQQANPNGTVAGFVAYLDAYQEAGGELPTSVELSEDVEGVRLMTLYQAKGLEFPIVIVPQLLEKEWPTQQGWGGLFPTELLREAVPPGDLHTEEERRLLYVAMTRAQRRLVLTTHGGPSATKRPSLFISEVTWGGGEDIRLVDRTTGEAASPFRAGAAAPDGDDAFDDGTLGLLDLDDDVVVAEPADAAAAAIAAARRVMPLPSARERRLALRLRASQLVGLMESTPIDAPETAAARELFADELTAVGRSAAMRADEARAAGLDPLTLRTVALDSGAGANLLQVAPLPERHSYSSLNTYEACPLKYAFGYVYRMPRPDKPVAPFTFGTTAHEAFEAFTRARREAVARGEAPPTRQDLEREFRARWVPADFGDQVTEATYGRRVQTLLGNFWEGEVASLGEAIAEEREFELVLEAPGDDEPVRIRGSIDRIDRLPGGGIEVIDYKTGSVSSQKDVDHSLQLSIYALACRDALGLGTPERVTLYFTESALRLSTTRTDEQLDAARADILARVAVMRSGSFTATPGSPCRYCDYRAMCPDRV
jgi:DNA helicase-2/ATP-dependent DNA helicase PcrA